MSEKTLKLIASRYLYKLEEILVSDWLLLKVGQSVTLYVSG